MTANINKATMVILNEMGCIVHRQINIIEFVENEKDVVIKYKLKGRRKLQGYRIKKSTKMILAYGWQQPAEGMTENRLYKNSFSYDIFTAFDGNLFLKSIKHIGNIFYNNY
jgi:hypothetical protein